MTTGGEVPGRSPGGVESEDLAHIKCQPCLEDGKLREVVGMCIDCDDVLCQNCYEIHRQPKPLRHHQLIDREQMIKGQIRASTKDSCTEKCPDHEDDVIKYYCLKHCMLGCNDCITLDHKTCDNVQYIPRVAKDLAKNTEYRQAEIRLKSTLDTFKTVSEKVEKNSAELEASCLEALNDIRDFRRKVNGAADKIENEIIEILQDIKSTEMKKIAAIGEKYKATLDVLKTSLTKITMLQKAKQHCSTYIEMMRTKDKLVTINSKIKEAEVDASYMKHHIRFSPNQEILDILKQVGIFGEISVSSRYKKMGTKHVGKIVRAAHAHDINVKTETDTSTCCILGITVLPGNRLVLADFSNNTIKLVSVQSGQVLTSLKLSSQPWDVTTISSNTVAVTMPYVKQITMLTVGDIIINIDRAVDVNGSCWGIDYRNDKLAVSYLDPHNVQVLSIQGAVLHDISGASLNSPHYLTFGLDDATLYVSNYGSHNVVHVKLDGTVMATYTDSELRGPLQPVVDDNGEVLVCGRNSHTIHQITNDCKKIRVLLSQTDGLSDPYAICFSEKKAKLYVGMWSNNNGKVYTIERVAG